MNSTLLSMAPLALLVLLAWAVMRSLKRSAAKTSPATGLADNSAGVGGWLLFLICGLIFLGLMIGAGRINADIMAAEAQYPKLSEVAAWSTYKTATWWSFVVVCCISCYSGYGLLKRRDQSVVRQAKVALWLIGPVANILMGLLLPLVIFGKLESNSQIVGGLIASVIVASIWTAYLAKSKRVKETYGGA
jgi:hypothetical protein